MAFSNILLLSQLEHESQLEYECFFSDKLYFYLTDVVFG